MRLSALLLAVACSAGALHAAQGPGPGPGPGPGRDRAPGLAGERGDRDFEEKMANLKEKHPELFARFDANKDGKLDEGERQAARAEMARRHPGADRDGDGQLSREELQAAKERLAGRAEEFKAKHPEMFARFDVNKDGTLDEAERQAAREAIERRILERRPQADRDGDGQLSREELQAARERLTDRAEEFKAKHPELFARFDANKDGTLDEAERQAARQELERRILERNPQADTDGDGRLSRDEFRSAHEMLAGDRIAQLKERHPRMFAKMDRNGDGTLDAAERQAAREHCERMLRERGPAVGGPDGEWPPRGDNGRRAHGEPEGDGHDNGRRGPE